MVALLASTGGASAQPTTHTSLQRPAVQLTEATRAPLLAAARVGQGSAGRVVAVGDHGTIVFSDDDGKSFHQAQGVPTQALLTCVSFVDDHQGWAAGHDGVILHTQDGGQSWALQHEDTDGDHPLFSIRFQDDQHGMAVGLFGLALATADGGNSWTPVPIESGDETDHHLYAIFGGGAAGSPLLVAGEAGAIYRSLDGGRTWTTIQTTNRGSFWAGAVLGGGRLLAVGQRGHVFLSQDQGLSWSEAPSGTQESLTGIAIGPGGAVLVTGLAGTTLVSHDNGQTWASKTRADRVPINAALFAADGHPLLFGGDGAMSGEGP